MKIILFRGRPGTGKTTLSDAFSLRTGFPVLRKDDIYDVVADFVHEHDMRNKISYGALWRILDTNAKSDAVFILDYPFQHSEDIEYIKTWCADRSVTLKSVLVTCSDEGLWSRRLDERTKKPAPNQLITDLASFKKLYGSLELSPYAGELLVDTVQLIEKIVSHVITYVQGKEKIS